MLDLRPNCECCDKDLPPDAQDAMICSYECTYCKKCVEDVIKNVCPNCGGGLVPRPIRPKVARRDGVSIDHHPASTKRVQAKYSKEDIAEFVQQYEHILPGER